MKYTVSSYILPKLFGLYLIMRKQIDIICETFYKKTDLDSFPKIKMYWKGKNARILDKTTNNLDEIVDQIKEIWRNLNTDYPI